MFFLRFVVLVLFLAIASSKFIPYTSTSSDGDGTSPNFWEIPSDYFLKRAQEIAIAKTNKGFEMKKEGIKIAQQAMKNKMAFIGSESKKPTWFTEVDKTDVSDPTSNEYTTDAQIHGTTTS